MFELFLLASVLILYVYVGYPVLAFVAGKLLNRQVRREPILPSVSLIIAAYNEDRDIRAKLENSRKIDYAGGSLQVIVASDGSTDRTVQITRENYPEVLVLDLPRRGKMHAVDDAVSRATGEILIFTDANISIEQSALRNLVQNYADPTVGGVAGSKKYRLVAGDESSAKGEQLYWSYDQLLKEFETRTGSAVSADGALYSVRKSLYRKPRWTDVTDDFAVSTEVIARGFRLVFDPSAVAYEAPVKTAGREFARKVRLMTRGLRGVLMRKALMNPFRFGFYSVALVSRKLLRRLVPIILIGLLLISLAGAPADPLLAAALLLQLLFYCLAAVGFLLRNHPIGRLEPLMAPFFYCLSNLASLVAVANTIRGIRFERWDPPRHGDA